MVIRYNVMTTSGPGGVQSHATGSAQNIRGCRAMEVYGNVFNGGGAGGGNFSADFQTSGTTLQWGNKITGFPHALSLVEDRDGNFTYGQSAPPAGWGYCGTAQTGAASPWDLNLNSNGSNGWPCLDQTGRGQSDLLSGTFSSQTGQYETRSAYGYLASPDARASIFVRRDMELAPAADSVLGKLWYRSTALTITFKRIGTTTRQQVESRPALHRPLTEHLEPASARWRIAQRAALRDPGEPVELAQPDPMAWPIGQRTRTAETVSFTYAPPRIPGPLSTRPTPTRIHLWGALALVTPQLLQQI